jgi:ATP/maltotriose-dependent transcriptional regulator MalT
VVREKELEDIHDNLLGNGSRQTIILHGLGGIGKTQLSVAYAKQHKDDYSAIFWLNTKDEDSLKQSFVKIAEQILRVHPSAGPLKGLNMKENLEAVVNAVKEWLSVYNNTRWLLIYDNYDNPRIQGNRDPAAVDIRKYLPESYQGSVIITTRSAQVRGGHRIKIEKFRNMQDSLQVLSYESQREDAMHGEDVPKMH